MNSTCELDQRTDGLVVLAVDDEEPALEELAHLLERDGRVETVVSAPSAVEALRVLTNWRAPGAHSSRPACSGPDAVFLDIGMPELNGMELAETLSRMEFPPPVVFVTADDSRAVAAFAVGAVDYLLKPLSAERLAASLDRIVTKAADKPARYPELAAAEDEVIPVELAGVMTLVHRSSVRYVEASGDYVRIHTAAGSHLARIPLKELADRWREAGFVKIHRSYLVALPLVTEVLQTGPNRVVKVGAGPHGQVLPVSRRNFRELKKRLTEPWK
jgi:DNA-binding LytR/AlgR family response regulator